MLLQIIFNSIKNEIKTVVKLLWMHETQPLNVICDQNKIMLHICWPKQNHVFCNQNKIQVLNLTRIFQYFMLFLFLLCKGKYYLPSCGFTENLRMTIYDSEICIVLVSNAVIHFFHNFIRIRGYLMVHNCCVHFTIWHLLISSSIFIGR